jgi:hypothetical protein
VVGISARLRPGHQDNRGLITGRGKEFISSLKGLFRPGVESTHLLFKFGPAAPHYRGFKITLSWTHHPRLDSSGRVISPMRKLYLRTQHSQERDIHVPSGIRSSNSKKQAVAEPRLRPCGHWNRPPPSLRSKRTFFSGN